jgi:hypothetical protein
MGRDGRRRDVPLPPDRAHRDTTVDHILGPMAFAIMGGLLVATVLLPALYVTYEPAGEGRVAAWASPDRFDSALASWRITSRECHARSRVRRPKIVKQEAAT